jgi:UDP-galactopyranose mutase
MEKFDIIIVGCGLSGTVLAERYANILNKRVLILDKRDHVGGNCYDYIDLETGLLISKYGPHFFHTDSEKVWKYVNKFSSWMPWEHKVLGRIGDKLFPIPVNINTINILLGTNISNEQEMKKWLKTNIVQYNNPVNGKQAVLSQVGQKLYELIFKDYSKKHWDSYPEELDASIFRRVTVRSDFEERYFTDKYQAQPQKGFTKLIENMLDHANITVMLNTDFFMVKDLIKSYEKLFFTGPIDHFYKELQIGWLGYRSLRFESEYIKGLDFYQTNSVINYPSLDDNFTRITEYKHILNQKSSDTIIFREYGSSVGEPYYPILNEVNRKLYATFKSISKKEKNIYFLGRLGSFKYINIDEAILNSLELFEKVYDK